LGFRVWGSGFSEMRERVSSGGMAMVMVHRSFLR
jgi:hypothetical protein